MMAVLSCVSLVKVMAFAVAIMALFLVEEGAAAPSKRKGKRSSAAAASSIGSALDSPPHSPEMETHHSQATDAHLFGHLGSTGTFAHEHYPELSFSEEEYRNTLKMIQEESAKEYEAELRRRALAKEQEAEAAYQKQIGSIKMDYERYLSHLNPGRHKPSQKKVDQKERSLKSAKQHLDTQIADIQAELQREIGGHRQEQPGNHQWTNRHLDHEWDPRLFHGDFDKHCDKVVANELRKRFRLPNDVKVLVYESIEIIADPNWDGYHKVFVVKGQHSPLRKDVFCDATVGGHVVQGNQEASFRNVAIRALTCGDKVATAHQQASGTHVTGNTRKFI